MQDVFFVFYGYGLGKFPVARVPAAIISQKEERIMVQRILLVAICVGLFSITGVSAAELSYSCDVRQGFNFEKDAQDLVGHINYLKIGGKEFKADLAVTDPENAQGDPVKVFGVLSSMFWKGGYSDPLQFSGQISTENKKMLATLLHQTMTNTKVEISFTIYDYDPDEKKYYKAFHSDGQKLQGLIQKSGGELNLALDMDQSQMVVSPKNYTLSAGVMPEDKQQAIQIAVSVSDKFAKQFGVTVGN